MRRSSQGEYLLDKAARLLRESERLLVIVRERDAKAAARVAVGGRPITETSARGLRAGS